MTDTSRRQKIEAMLADEPDDQFLRYSLALELEKEGEHDRSLEGLRQLSADDPPHVPSFFMAGQQLAKLARYAEAITILESGVQAARRQGDDHAVAEMTEFLLNVKTLSS